MRQPSVRRHSVTLSPDSARVILRPFLPATTAGIAAMIGRALDSSEATTQQSLETLRREFGDRHLQLERVWQARFESVRSHVPAARRKLSSERQLVIGALFSSEYSLESAALFNPSLVPHPDQSGLPPGALRFIMSLRATGEGHISSIEFRSGEITGDGDIRLDPVSRYVTAPSIEPNPRYRKQTFALKFQEMGFDNSSARSVLAPLGETFTRQDLDRSVAAVSPAKTAGDGHELTRTLECAQWLADSNYELRFAAELSLSERIIFPVSANETHGIEDARFVRFTEDNGDVNHYATYTAFNGRVILPMLLETRDFLHFQVRTLNGDAVQNKGMALFPRRIGGRYAMLSRQDDENILIMFSKNLHFWSRPRVLLRPAAVWEAVKIGNCGSPILTAQGWLVITHGVGPMRKYCIGAALLDRDDPTIVLGRLSAPLISPEGIEREGYVPNVVYSCGSLVHGGRLFLPYAMSDTTTAIASLDLNEVLAALTA